MILKPKFFNQNLELILKSCEVVFKFALSYRKFFYEQDVLNYLFSKTYKKLSGEFNVLLVNQRINGKKPLRLKKAIYHFAGGKPDMDTDDIYNQIYFEYFMKTPWANVDMFGNIGKFVRRLYNSSKDSLLHFVNLMTERKRAFFMDKNHIEPMKQIFRIKADEPIFTLQDDGDNLLEKITATKGSNIFILLIGSENYHKARIYLLSQGFIESVDFVDGSLFLSERYILESDFIHLSRALVQEL